MKLILLVLSLTLGAWAQTGQICYAPDKAVPGKATCRDIPTPLKASLGSFIAATTTTGPVVNGVPTQIPVYQGIADLIFQNLSQGLFATIVAQNPPAALKTALTAVDTAKATANTAQTAVIAAPAPAPDPQ